MLITAWVLFGIAALLGIWGLFSIFADGEGFGIILFGAIVLLLGFGALHSHQASDVPHLTAAEACVPSSARSMPVPATLHTARDNRLGTIYPCMYLMDMGFQPGQPAPLLGHIQESVFSESQFQASSSWGGVLILGTGGGSGHSKAQGSTKRHDMYAFMAQAKNGAYTKFLVDADSVQLATCKRCQASATMRVDNRPMYTKRADEFRDQSIWVRFPGGLRSPGSMLQSLARVVITLPAALTPQPIG